SRRARFRASRIGVALERPGGWHGGGWAAPRGSDRRSRRRGRAGARRRRERGAGTVLGRGSVRQSRLLARTERRRRPWVGPQRGRGGTRPVRDGLRSAGTAREGGAAR